MHLEKFLPPFSHLPTKYLCSEEIHGTYRLKICTNDKSLRVECLAYIHDGFDILEYLLLLPNHHYLGFMVQTGKVGPTREKTVTIADKLIITALSQIIDG